MLEVGALALHRLMHLAQPPHGLAAAVAAFLAAAHPALRLLQFLLTPAVAAWILHRFPVSGDEKDLQPNINASFFASHRHGSGWHVGARDDGIPAIRLV